MDFAAKKAGRIASGKSAASTSSSASTVAPTPPASFASLKLPPSVRAQSTEKRGRGLHTTKKVQPGDVIFSTTPLVSVLDNSSLLTRCSACFDASVDASQTLLRCTRCKIVRYCSPACQAIDWVHHKPECTALQQYTKSKPGRKGSEPSFPDTPIRALARLLWTKIRIGDPFWGQVQTMQSHRSDLTGEQKIPFFQLSVSLSQYMVEASSLFASATDLIDLCCRFTSNSFSLSSTHAENIGVSISPMTALINHSCSPNAVVVFPSRPSANSPPSYSADCDISSTRQFMQVLAIRPIAPGEEILTSYIDLSLPRRMRVADLKERYYFDCDCAACEEGRIRSATVVDPRESLQCQVGGCQGVAWLPDLTRDLGLVDCSCTTCGASQSINAESIKTTIENIEQALQKYESLQNTDRESATKAVAKAARQLGPMKNCSQSTYPLLALTKSLALSAVDRKDFRSALAYSEAALQGTLRIFPVGHPSRVVELAKVAKLRYVGEELTQAQTEGEDSFNGKESRESHLFRCRITLDVAIEAAKEVEIGFGSRAALTLEVRGLIKQVEDALIRDAI